MPSFGTTGVESVQLVFPTMSNIQPLSFLRASMLNYIEAVDEPFDVAVIGGGATGVYTALDAASRGFRTVLFERGDFASGTSSLSTKLIHGGVRYMQQGRLRLVRESLKERRYLLNNAPHLVRTLPILVPAYSRWQRLKYSTGVVAYDAVSRGYGLGGTRRLGRHEAIESVPGIQQDGLKGGAIYLDGQTDDARLALAIAKTAAAHGAALVNYAEVRVLKTQAGRITGIEAEDLVTGNSISIDAKVVINATGKFTDQTLGLDPGGSSGIMRWSRGTHVVLDGSLLGDHGLLVPETTDGRVVFALPWLGKTLVGTTDIQVDSPDADHEPPQEDVDFLLSEISAYLPAANDAKLLSAFTGIRPLVSSDRSSSTSNIARSHRVLVSDSGLVSIAGGKWTTARLMADDVLQIATEVGGLPSSKSATDTLKLDGFQSEEADPLSPTMLREPDSTYGAGETELRKLEQASPELEAQFAEGLPYRLSHAVFAMQNEMAQTLEDVLARRTRSLFLDVAASEMAAKTVAVAVERHCQVETGWADREVTKLTDVLKQFRSPSVD